MEFTKIENFELMRVGITPNGLDITKELIDNLIERHEFDNAPVVFNSQQQFRDYRVDDIVRDFRYDQCIGYVLRDTVRFDGVKVTATVMLDDSFANRTHYDNWCIQMDGSECEYQHCELFYKEED